MNKQEIINDIAEEHDLTKIVAKSIFDKIFDDILEAAMSESTGNKFQIPGFGVFTIQTKEARMGRNPRTGESMHIPEKQVIKFKASKSLLDKIN